MEMRAAIFLCVSVCLTQFANGFNPTDEEKRTGIIKGKYLAQMKDGRTASDLIGILFVRNLREYTIGEISIAAFEMDDEQVHVLRNHPSIQHLEPNGLTHLIEPVEIRAPPKLYADIKKGADHIIKREGCNTQALNTDFDEFGTWGLIRTSYWHAPDNFTTHPYLWSDNTDGTGVLAYVFDTGIELNHTDFDGRAIHGFDAPEFEDEGVGDHHGHGTHVASTVGGTIYGMAKNCTLVDVKALGRYGWGHLESNIHGLEWVAKDVQRRRGLGERVKGVINHSLGYGWHSHIFFNAVQQTVNLGIANVASAGNSAQDGRIFTPAAFTNTITVGAIERENDRMVWWSNFGPNLDISAPGVLITGAWSNYSTMCDGQEDNQCLATVSGTSMSAPHVAGAIARYLSSITDEEYDNMNPADVPEHVRNKIVEYSGKGFLKFQNANQKTTPNRYLFFPCGVIPDDHTTTTTTTTPYPPDAAGRLEPAVGLLMMIVIKLMLY